MDGPANNVVAPGLVVVAKRLLAQPDYAVLDTVPLRVAAPAELLRRAAQALDSTNLVTRVGDVRAGGLCQPGV